MTPEEYQKLEDEYTKKMGCRACAQSYLISVIKASKEASEKQLKGKEQEEFIEKSVLESATKDIFTVIEYDEKGKVKSVGKS